jgi:hypothetical protein
VQVTSGPRKHSRMRIGVEGMEVKLPGHRQTYFMDMTLCFVVIPDNRTGNVVLCCTKTEITHLERYVENQLLFVT